MYRHTVVVVGRIQFLVSWAEGLNSLLLLPGGPLPFLTGWTSP